MLDQPEPEPSFEQALTQLERIIASLERGEPELTTALAKYEKGFRLLILCHRLLDQAEQSVALLTGVDDQGNPLTVPFDTTATIAREGGSTGSTSTTPIVNDPNRRTPERPSPAKNRAISQNNPNEAYDPPF
ncbi:MAG: exodeoxyribonuclease VII small subunit [Isosphaerales bacterium]